MIPAASSLGNPKSITAALTGPSSVILRLNGQNVSTLQGELMGLIMGMILSSTETRDARLYSDHMNSIRLIEDLRSSINQATQLRNMNGHSYY